MPTLLIAVGAEKFQSYHIFADRIEKGIEFKEE